MLLGLEFILVSGHFALPPAFLVVASPGSGQTIVFGSVYQECGHILMFVTVFLEIISELCCNKLVVVV